MPNIHASTRPSSSLLFATAALAPFLASQADAAEILVNNAFLGQDPADALELINESLPRGSVLLDADVEDVAFNTPNSDPADWLAQTFFAPRDGELTEISVHIAANPGVDRSTLGSVTFYLTRLTGDGVPPSDPLSAPGSSFLENFSVLAASAFPDHHADIPAGQPRWSLVDTGLQTGIGGAPIEVSAGETYAVIAAPSSGGDQYRWFGGANIAQDPAGPLTNGKLSRTLGG